MEKITKEPDKKETPNPYLTLTGDAFIDFGNLMMDVLSGLRRHCFVVLLTMALFSGLLLAYGKKSYVPQYSSWITFVIDVNHGMESGSLAIPLTIMSTLSSSVPNIVSDSNFTRLVAKDLGQAYVPGTINVQVLEETNMFTVTTTAADPKLATDIGHSVIKCFPAFARDMVGTTTVTIISESGPASQPLSGSNVKLFTALGAVVGLVLWIMAFGMYSLLKSTVRKMRDCERFLHIVCIGGIPKVRLKGIAKKEKRSILITENSSGYDFRESVRTLSSRIERDQRENNTKIYCITSTLTGEGKSTLSSNLAIALAEEEHKVVLIDMDIYNPSILKIFGKENFESSLVDVLDEKDKTENIYVQTENPNVVLIPGVKNVEEKNSIADNPGLQEVIDEISETADIVLIDAVPVGEHFDAVTISELSEAIIYVVEQGLVPAETIRENTDLLKDCGVRFMGVVINKAVVGLDHYIGDYETVSIS